MHNHFKLFGLEPRFDIDLKALNARYRELAQQSHPDRFVNESSEKQREAVQRSATLNEAYKTLKNPVTRAEYLLSKIHLEPKGESFEMIHYHVTDTELLMQQIEYREQLAELHGTEEIDSLNRFQKDTKSLIKRTTDKISEDFESLNESAVTDLKNQICELRFLEKLMQDADELEEQMLEKL